MRAHALWLSAGRLSFMPLWAMSRRRSDRRVWSVLCVWRRPAALAVGFHYPSIVPVSSRAIYSKQRTVTANTIFHFFVYFSFLQPRNIDYRTYKTTLKVQVNWSKMQLFRQYYVNYDVKVLQSTCWRDDKRSHVGWTQTLTTSDIDGVPGRQRRRSI